jgi:hypothetical protein
MKLLILLILIPPPFKSLHHVTLLCIKITTVFIVTTITILQISTLRMRVHVMCVYIYILFMAAISSVGHISCNNIKE